MAKLTAEISWHVAAPADFVQEWMLDIRNWGKANGSIPAAAALLTPLVNLPDCTWEGDPWITGSRLVMRTRIAGVPTTIRCTAVEPHDGEFCCYEQKAGFLFAKQTYTYSYSVTPRSDISSELTYRTYVDGWASKFSPTARKSAPESAHAYRIIEDAWARSKELHAGGQEGA
jgi:hypothetical protein